MKSKYLFIHLIFFISNSGFAQTPFISTWKTQTSTDPSSTSITIPTTGTGYNYDVDWNNDGIYDQIGITGDVTHNFGTAGIYKIRIKGAFPRIYFNNGLEKEKILEINQWGDIAWTSMESAFFGCYNLTEQADDSPNLTGVTNLSTMFAFCLNLNQDISNWDTQKINNMSHMFNNASSFNQPINSWKTINVTNMSGMFFKASSFNQPLNNWNAQNVTDMSQMFWRATSFNQSLNDWNTQSVTNMTGMFGLASLFNQPLNNWDTGNVTSMGTMFMEAASFNQPIENWNTENVTEMGYMFMAAFAFNQPLNSWNTRNVTNMNGMFAYASSFNQPIGNWNTQLVTSMNGIFNNAISFNQPLTNWNTVNVTDITKMFYNAQSFNQSIGNLNLKNIINLEDIIFNTNIDCTNYSATLIGWANNPETPDGKTLDASGRQYGNFTVNARNLLLGKGWTITGDNLSTSTNCSCINMYTVKSGNWYDGKVWSCNRTPTLLDELLIKGPHVVDLTSGQIGTAKKITIDLNAILDIKNGGSLNFTN